VIQDMSSAPFRFPPAAAPRRDPFRKPGAICAGPPRREESASRGEVERYVAVRQRRIERQVASLGLRLHTPGPERLDDILRFAGAFHAPSRHALNAYEVHRVLAFGRPLVLLGPGGEILGYDLAFDSTRGDSENGERTLGTCGYRVAPALAGHNLGARMVVYSALRAMAAGTTLRRGIVGPCNAKSLTTLLHHLGAVCDGFIREFGNWGEPRFTHACRLTPAGLSNNRIDPRKLGLFLATARRGRDFLLLDAVDSETLERVYHDTPFRVIAVVPGARDLPALVAVPAVRD
jgi:hypothetical protein